MKNIKESRNDYGYLLYEVQVDVRYLKDIDTLVHNCIERVRQLNEDYFVLVLDYIKEGQCYNCIIQVAIENRFELCGLDIMKHTKYISGETYWNGLVYLDETEVSTESKLFKLIREVFSNLC